MTTSCYAGSATRELIPYLFNKTLDKICRKGLEALVEIIEDQGIYAKFYAQNNDS